MHLRKLTKSNYKKKLTTSLHNLSEFTKYKFIKPDISKMGFTKDLKVLINMC